MQKLKGSSGFTLIEMLVALMLLGILMVMISALMSIMSNISQKTDKYVEGESDAAYVLSVLQKDLMYANAIDLINEKEFTVLTEDDHIEYHIDGSTLFREGRILVGNAYGSFSYTDRKFNVSLMLSNRSIIDTSFYIRGY